MSDNILGIIEQGNKVNYHRSTKHLIHVAIKAKNIVHDLDFAETNPEKLKMTALDSLNTTYHSCLSTIPGYDGYTGTFLNYCTKTGYVDIIEIQGKLTKVGLKLKRLEVIMCVGRVANDVFHVLRPKASVLMEDVYVTSKNTTVKFFGVYHSTEEDLEETVNQKLSYTTANIEGFAGFQKPVKLSIAEDDVESMLNIASEAFMCYDDTTMIFDPTTRNGQYFAWGTVLGKYVRIFKNKTSECVEWYDGNITKRVTLFANRAILGWWTGGGTRLTETHHACIKDKDRLFRLQQAKLIRSLQK